MLSILDDPLTDEMIRRGFITLGAIKPHTEDSSLGVKTDEEGEKKIFSMVKPPLIVLAAASFIPTDEDIEAFYPQEVKEKMIHRVEDGESVWEGYKRYMTSGPVTYFLLYNPDGNAVDTWRAQAGKTNPKDAQEGTIRRFAKSIKQNLVHGSNSDNPQEKPMAVKKEVDWLKERIRKVLSRLDQEDKYTPTEDLLRSVNVIGRQEHFVLAVRDQDFIKAGSETYLAVYTVVTRNVTNNEVKFRKVAQKSVVSFGSPVKKAEIMYKRLSELQSLGVRTPELYGLRQADIYQEYIEGSKGFDEAFSLIKSDETPEDMRSGLIGELAKIAAVLDKNGFSHLGNFSGDLIFDGKHLYFVDGGWDLGDADPKNPKDDSLVQLKKLLGDRFGYLIDKAYDYHFQNSPGLELKS